VPRVEVQMASKATKQSRLTAALLETAKDMREGGVLDNSHYKRITARHLEEVGTLVQPHPAALRASTLPEDGEG
jgi:hypothetical protein